MNALDLQNAWDTQLQALMHQEPVVRHALKVPPDALRALTGQRTPAGKEVDWKDLAFTDWQAALKALAFLSDFQVGARWMLIDVCAMQVPLLPQALQPEALVLLLDAQLHLQGHLSEIETPHPWQKPMVLLLDHERTASQVLREALECTAIGVAQALQKPEVDVQQDLIRVLARHQLPQERLQP